MLKAKERLLELNSKFAQTLSDKGVAVNENETTSELIEKVAEIESVELFNNDLGRLYTKNMILTDLIASNEVSKLNNMYANCVHLETVEMDGGLRTGADSGIFYGCENLRSAKLKNITSYGHYIFRSCLSLENAELGYIGKPVIQMAVYTFYNCTQNDLKITIYVDSTTLAGIPEKITSGSPWGATNATIIYRNSTTGEVIEE